MTTPEPSTTRPPLSIRRTESVPRPLPRAPLAPRCLVVTDARELTVEQSASELLALRERLARSDEETEERRTIALPRLPFPSIPVEVDLGELRSLPPLLVACPVASAPENEKAPITLRVWTPVSAPAAWQGAPGTRLPAPVAGPPTMPAWGGVLAPAQALAPRNAHVPAAAHGTTPVVNRFPKLVRLGAVALGAALITSIGMLTAHAAHRYAPSAAPAPASPTTPAGDVRVVSPAAPPPSSPSRSAGELHSTDLPGAPPALRASTEERRAIRFPRRLAPPTSTPVRSPRGVPQRIEGKDIL